MIGPVPVGVRLANIQKPIFPARCVGCGQEEPRHSVTIWTSSSSWWMIVTILALFWMRFAKARVPMCRRCAWRLRLRRLGYGAYFAAALAVSGWGVAHFTPKLPKLIVKLLAFAAVVVVMLPYVVLEVLRPPAISLDLNDELVTYQFRDADIAEEFCELNRGEFVPVE
jgi:hypothetical protein